MEDREHRDAPGNANAARAGATLQIAVDSLDQAQDSSSSREIQAAARLAELERRAAEHLEIAASYRVRAVALALAMKGERRSQWRAA